MSGFDGGDGGKVKSEFGGGGGDGEGGGSEGGPEAVVLQEPTAVGADGLNRGHVIELLKQSRSRWLKNTEVCDILLNYKSYDFELSANAPDRPPGMTPGARARVLGPVLSLRPFLSFSLKIRSSGYQGFFSFQFLLTTKKASDIKKFTPSTKTETGNAKRN